MLALQSLLPGISEQVTKSHHFQLYAESEKNYNLTIQGPPRRIKIFQLRFCNISFDEVIEGDIFPFY